MKHILLIFILLLPVMTFGQSNRAMLSKAKRLEALAEKNNDNGNYAEAIRLETVAAETYKNVLGNEHTKYADALRRLAQCHYAYGNYTEGIDFCTMAAEIYKNAQGEECLGYVKAISNLAGCYFYVGNYNEAFRLESKAIEIIKKKWGDKHLYYALSMSHFGCMNDAAGNYNEAIEQLSIAIEIYKKVWFIGEKHPLYASALMELGMVYSATGNYDEAIRLGTIGTEIFRKKLGEQHPQYAHALDDIACHNAKSGNYAEAIRLGILGTNLRKDILGKKNPDYAESLRHLASFYLSAKEYSEAEVFFSKGYECTNSFILKNFSSMTNRERSDFWHTLSGFYSAELPYAAYKHSDSAFNTLAYNGQVFSKGLLLNTELEIQKLIEKSGDTTLAMRYQRIKNNRSMLDALYQLPPKERKTDTDSLLKIIDKEERLLVESSKELGDYTKNLSIDFKDIQKNLKDNDLAIEFANFKDTALKQEIYIALVLKKGMTAPELVKLFDGTDFEKINSKEYYKKSDFYNLVWKKLETYLTGVKNVYFSPCGMFHTVGIEYLPDENRKIFAEKFNVYRLSSTRELALEHKQNPNNKAATYGGIKYDSDKDDGNVRGVATYLKGTKIESETVAKLLRSADFSVIALSDTLATEESFKNLSGSGLKILHIGTHGFYYAAENLENAGFSFFSDKQQSEEDKAMSCSGLLFAGANFALDTENRSALPEGDDGILTAKEISRLDFQGLDLVVLSACQTGLGEVTGEGVFGLQRGFKKAGAQTIIMSLWEVDDYATRLLMTEFFKGLTAGKSKREAFLSAQKFVKAKNSDPKYWAAFVMVDGE